MSLNKEIEMEDRINFENIVMKIYRISEYYELIKQSLLDLFKIRFAVKE